MMHDFIMDKDCELWDLIQDGHFAPTRSVKVDNVTTQVLKTKKEINDADRKKIENNYKAKKISVCATGTDEYNRIIDWKNKKEI